MLDNCGVCQLDNTNISPVACRQYGNLTFNFHLWSWMLSSINFCLYSFSLWDFQGKWMNHFNKYRELFLRMKTHFYLFALVLGLVDNSGLRLFHTTDVRKYDAGVIEAGLWVSLFHTIPPGMPEFQSEGHCTLECLEEVCFISIYVLLFTD